jgi:hypothetical protein
MSGQLGELVVSLSADIARFQSDMGKASRIASEHADKISKSFDSLQSVVSGVGKSFGVITATLAGGAMFGSVVSEAKKVADEVKKLKESFGISAEGASVLRVALDDTFVSADSMMAASSRLTKQIVGNEEAFKKLGVSIKDSGGNLRPTVEIIADVNTQLLKFKEGTDRNVEGVKIYGKGWEEARQTLKLTASAMSEAKDRAQELGVVFSGDKLASIKAYKTAMKDLDDVAESVKVQIGMALIPELTKLATSLSGPGVTAIKAMESALNLAAESIKVFKDNSTEIIVFATALAAPAIVSGIAGLAAALMDVSVSVGLINAAMAANPAGFAALTAAASYFAAKSFDKGLYGLTGIDITGMNDPGTQGIDEERAILARAKARLADAKREKESSLTSTGASKRESDFNAANAKYLEYLKAFEEKKAALAKAGAELGLEINRDAYAWGLKDLTSYLDNEHDLRMVALNSEIAAKKKQLENANSAFGTLQPSVGQKGESRPDKDLAAYNDLLKKREDAEKAFIEAQSKADIEEKKFARSRYETIMQSTVEMTKAQETIAEMNGEWDKSKVLQIDLINLEIQKAQTTVNGSKESIPLLVRQREELEKMRSPLGALTLGLSDFANEAGKTAEYMRSSIFNAFSSMTDALADFVATGKMNFTDLAQSIIKDMARIAIQQNITGPLASGLSGLLGGMFGGGSAGGGASTNIGAFMPEYAMGGVFGSSGLSAYSNSVVSRPTLFPFARGIGLMGEAGSEAILPLKRTSSGNLGVESSGGGVNITINNNASGVQATAEVTNNGNGGKSIEVMIDEVMSRNMMKSGSLSSKALSLRGAGQPMARR